MLVIDCVTVFKRWCYVVIFTFLGFSESGDPSCTIMQIWAKIEVLILHEKHITNHITRKENVTA